MVRKVIVLLLVLCPLLGNSQGSLLGLNPSNIKWRQIDTDKVQVIFPEGLEHRAQRAANIMHMLYDSSYYALGDQDDKITMIVQNQTTSSNGFVSPFGPIRTEFFTTPPQFSFLGNVTWWDALAIHEYRHVEQVFNAKRGWTKIASVLFGQNGLGGGAGLALPRWFFEGDATVYETLLTTGGRGRTPNFDRQYRSLLLSDRFYGYEKASAFSIRDFVPNHYAHGYYLTTHIRRKYGDGAITKAAQDASAYRGIIYPFSNGLKRHTGLTPRQLHKEAFSELQAEWKQEASQLDLTPSNLINTTEKKAFTSYQLPVFVTEDELLVQKRGLRDIRQIVRINTAGVEKRVLTPGLVSSLNATHDVANDKIVYSELAYDERWGNQDFSIIKIFDQQSRQIKKLTNKSKYFAPDFSPDGSKVVVVEVTPETKYSLKVLDSNSGQVLWDLPNPDNSFLSFPRFKSETEIITIVQRDNKNALGLVDISTGEMKVLSPFQVEQISYPRPFGDYIFFTSTLTGIDNIHVWDLERNREFQVTSTLLGATQADVSPSGKKLAFSEFTADGWDLRTITINPNEWRELKGDYPSEIDFYKPLDKYGSILDKVPATTFPTKEYNKLNGLLNLHSWSPVAIHPEYGAGIFLGNKFSTFQAQGLYEYNVNERASSWSANAKYAELYPVLEAGVRRSDRSRTTRFYVETDNNGETISSFQTRNVGWVETDISGGISLPLNLSGGNHFGNMELKAELHQLDIEYDDRLEGTSGFFNAAELGLDFSRFQTRASQQVVPRWGQFLNIDYLSTLNTETNMSEYFQISSRLFFPGILPTHGFGLRGAFRQENSEASYKFRDIFSYARGYNIAINSDQIWVVGAQYSFPIWLPDIAVGPLAFIKRIKGTAFFDISQSTWNQIAVGDLPAATSVSVPRDAFFPEFNVDYRSAGFDLRFDMRIFRIADIDLGVRYAYLLDSENVNLSSPHRILPILASFSF